MTVIGGYWRLFAVIDCSLMGGQLTIIYTLGPGSIADIALIDGNRPITIGSYLTDILTFDGYCSYLTPLDRG